MKQKESLTLHQKSFRALFCTPLLHTPSSFDCLEISFKEDINILTKDSSHRPCQVVQSLHLSFFLQIQQLLTAAELLTTENYLICKSCKSNQENEVLFEIVKSSR